MSIQVAIDGPSASGKGTVAKKVAHDCNLIYIDTGAMYRAIAYATIKNNLSLDDEDAIVKLAESSKIEFISDKIYLNGQDVSKEIRTMEVSKIVSPISSIVKLRDILVNMQQNLALGNNVIMDGRDITTVVLPFAKYKFYLDADVNERAKRRFKELKERGDKVTFEETLENIKNRDYNDIHKKVGALTRTNDSIYIDSTNLSVDEVVSIIESKIEVDL